MLILVLPMAVLANENEQPETALEEPSSSPTSSLTPTPIVTDELFNGSPSPSPSESSEETGELSTPWRYWEYYNSLLLCI